MKNIKHGRGPSAMSAMGSVFAAISVRTSAQMQVLNSNFTINV